MQFSIILNPIKIKKVLTIKQKPKIIHVCLLFLLFKCISYSVYQNENLSIV